MSAPQNRPNPAPIAEQQTKAYRMAVEGRSVRFIADALGVSVGCAHARLKAAIESIPQAERATQRAITLARYERMVELLTEQLNRGRDPVELTPELRAIEKDRRRLLGLDEAVKVDATVHEVTQADLELAQIIREAQARSEARERQIHDEGENHR